MNDHVSTADRRARTALAAAVVRDAGKLALRRFLDRERLTVEKKGAQDFVSQADREAEERIRERLAALFPGEAVLGEEGGGATADALWIVDPIDGTANFLRGIPYWSVALAFAVEGRPVVGLIYDPVHDELFAAARGLGATRNGETIRASAVAEPGGACLGLGYAFKADPARYLEVVRGLLDGGYDHKRYGSSALSLAHTADGRLDGQYSAYAHSWDVVAGLLLVEEAGGYAHPFGDDPTAAGDAWACCAGLREPLGAIFGGR